MRIVKRIMAVAVITLCGFYSISLSVQAKGYTCTEIENKSLSMSRMYSDGNSLHIIGEPSDYTENQKETSDITVDGSGNITDKSVNQPYEKLLGYDAKNDKYYFCGKLKKDSFTLKIYDGNGSLEETHNIGKLPEDIKPYSVDVMKVKDKIHFVTGYFGYSSGKRIEGIYINIYDIKNKKMALSKKIDADKAYLFSGVVIGIKGSVINEYSLKGKKIRSYAVPKGSTHIAVHNTAANEADDKIGYRGIDCDGKYIYYCNRNGVYRCSMKKNGKFKMIYNGKKQKNDGLFNSVYGREKGVYDIKVLHDGSFYLCAAGSSDSACPAHIYHYSKR